MKHLVIYRGLPGSGKSFRANKLASVTTGVICSADDYHVNKATGRYEWDPKKIGEAHAWCRGKAEGLMAAGHPVVIIDNTNIQHWQFAPYLELAAKFGYETEVAEPPTSWAWDTVECWRRNTHLVPLETIVRMKEQYEP